MRGPVRWVLWDVKDTLLKVRRSVGEQYCNEASRLGLDLPHSQVEAAFKQAYRRQSKLYPNYGMAQGLGGHRWWVAVVKETFRQCGVTDSTMLDKLSFNLYHNFKHAENWEVFPDSDRTLRSCVAMGLKLGVVSNFDNRLEGILHSCGLLSHFSFLLTSEGAKVAKPDAGMFNLALQRCGEPAFHVAHVGDHYVNDYLTARSLGIRGYLLDRDNGTQYPDVPPRHILTSLDQLPAALERITER